MYVCIFFFSLWGSAPKKQFQVLRKSNKTVCKTTLPNHFDLTRPVGKDFPLDNNCSDVYVLAEYTFFNPN